MVLSAHARADAHLNSEIVTAQDLPKAKADKPQPGGGKWTQGLVDAGRGIHRSSSVEWPKACSEEVGQHQMGSMSVCVHFISMGFREGEGT